ncbi:MAG: hypothetical protein JSW59_14815 [Phycisphaerales bacterium]|nr:MAG: hypothetical protein JSW59_14815 [Phycisphaerales bacterium]
MSEKVDNWHNYTVNPSGMAKQSKTTKAVMISSMAAAVCCITILVAITGPCRILTTGYYLDRVLHRTDHESLLNACRSIMKDEYIGRYDLTGSDKHPDADKLPKEILALKPPRVVVFDDGRVIIVMLGGMSHWGVVAYAEDFKESYVDYVRGNKKLIDGLWFYSDFIDLNAE